MKINTTSHSTRVRKLTDAQSRHTKRLKKVEKARVRLEKASQKLHKLEAEIADLARSAHDTRLLALNRMTRQPPKLRQALLIFNPQSKAAREGTYSTKAIVDCLRTYGIDAELGLKTSGKIARRLA